MKESKILIIRRRKDYIFPNGTIYGDVDYFTWCRLECERLNKSVKEFIHTVCEEAKECWVERIEK